jgi:hypothetical protein
VPKVAKIVCCDIKNKEGIGYQNFQNWLVGTDSCCQITESCWVVLNSETTTQVTDRLTEYFGVEGRIFVANLEKGSSSWSNVLDTSKLLQNILNH